MAKKTVAATAADPTVRFTRLDLNGRTFLLAYDFDSIAQAEELTGLELLVGVDWSKINARRLRAMLYASLLKAQPKISLNDITPLLTLTNLPLIETALTAAWLNSTPTPEDKGENPPEPEPVPAEA